MLDVEVIETPEAAAALDPIRSRVLAVLAEPGSATTVARALGLPRQKVNYHLRALEARGLVTLVTVRASTTLASASRFQQPERAGRLKGPAAREAAQAQAHAGSAPGQALAWWRAHHARTG